MSPLEEWCGVGQGFSTSSSTGFHVWAEKEKRPGVGRRSGDDRTRACFDCVIPAKVPHWVPALHPLLYDKSVTTKAREAGSALDDRESDALLLVALAQCA